MRNLQSLLAERDEEVRDLQSDKSRLEIEAENLQQRAKTLDESEHRYKEENWNLETRLQENTAREKEAADREKKLTQALNHSKAEKNATQKELDEVKLSHAKLSEEHAAAVKHHDIELGTAKRNMVMAEGERSTLQRKIDDLTNQNQELAKAFSSQRGRVMEREPMSGMSDEDFDTANDHVTPEHSPPPSPVKGTPRHSMLESETIKTSLHHAQRTIQSQRSQIHREKTEKLELRRIIQDLRDDLEKHRADGGGSSTNRRSRKVDSKEFKKPNRLLGSMRSSKQEIFFDDPEWEDNQGGSPRSPSTNMSSVSRQAGDAVGATDSSDHFDTANEASESAFETANERGTETEDFQTGNENMSGSDDAETETESMSRGFGKMKQTPRLPAALVRPGNRNSFHSTASTSADEDDFDMTEIKTPTGTLSSRRSKGRLSHLFNNSRQGSEEPMRSSPASFVSSATGTPQAGQSLFAELQDMGSDEESVGAVTPSRRSTRSATPGSTHRALSPAPAVPALPKVVMVDSGVMTEPVKIGPETPTTDTVPVRLATVEEDADSRPKSMESVVGPAGKRASMSWLSTREDETDRSRPVSTFSYSDAGAQYEQDMDKALAKFPVPPMSPPTLSLSTIQSEGVEPQEEPETPPPALSLAPISVEVVEPRAEPEVPLPTLSLSTIVAEGLEPRSEPEIPLPELTLTTINTQMVDPVAEPEVPPAALSLSNILTEIVEPVAEPEVAPIPIPVPPTLSLSSVMGHHIHPVAEPEPPVVEVPVPEPPALGISSIMAQSLEPVSEPEVVVPPPALSLTSIHVEALEPEEEPDSSPAPPSLTFTNITTEEVEPVSEPQPLPPALGLSHIVAEDIHPVHEPSPAPPKLAISSIAAEGVEPVNPPVEVPTLPNFGFSTIESIETEPISPRNWRDAFILPRDKDADPFTEKDKPETPHKKVFGLFGGRGKSTDSPIIAEDETRQSPGDTPGEETPESQRPFKEISTNSNARPARKHLVDTSDQSAQTDMTADAIDKMMRPSGRPAFGHEKSLSVDSVGSAGSAGTVRIHRSRESLDNLARTKGKLVDNAALETSSVRRPGSAGSARASVQDAPPLPPNHRELIEAARTGSAHGSQTNMGPPLWPASVLKNRPRTPSQTRPMSSASGHGTPTPRAVRTGSAHGHAELHSPTKLTARSRASSVSSFASELDSRFNMRPSEMGIDPAGFGPNTDPRMIQAITQTMIGEHLWKYTRKTGRGEMSEKRHRRYFWVHPYTRTLYWSDRDPSTAGRTELKAKSVPIEAVRVVTDDNPMPPGLHRKSLIVISPGRTIKFTCTTGQRHETWFNALSYLLLRTNKDAQNETEEMAENITSEDVDEFNPQYGRRPANGHRPPVAPSLSSYNSRTTHNESPAGDMSMNIPTLTPTGQRNPAAQRPSGGTFSKLSGYWKSNSQRPSGMFGSFRSRAASGNSAGIYEASEVHDSAEDLREMIERQDRESDRLENVRACCDGK